jgi:riboflavin kinase/FMN adenylyltransferase
MRVIRHVSEVKPAAGVRVAAAGRFDGLHRGHRRVLAQVVDRARAAAGEATAIVAHERGADLRLSDRRQQLEGLRDAGLDLVVFAPAAELDAAVDRVGVTTRVAARGSGARAPAGGTLEEIAAVETDGAAVTTEAIRAALRAGDLRAARALLGRDPGVAGRIVHGFHRGGPLGIPTANLRVRGIQLPPDGVYAVRARVAGAEPCGVANIVSIRPSVTGRVRSRPICSTSAVTSTAADWRSRSSSDCAANRSLRTSRRSSPRSAPTSPRRGVSSGSMAGEPQQFEWLVGAEAAGMRLDRFLTQREVLGTRSQVHHLIADGYVSVGDRR